MNTKWTEIFIRIVENYLEPRQKIIDYQDKKFFLIVVPIRKLVL